MGTERTVRPRKLLGPGVVMGTAVGYLVLALAASYAVDVHDVFGLRTRMVAAGLDTPGAWFYLFSSRGLVEILQWAALAVTAAVASNLGGWLTAHGQWEAGRFWSLLGVLSVLLLLEDTGNTRYIMEGTFGLALHAAGIGGQLPVSVGVMTVLLTIGALAGIALYTVARYGHSVWPVVSLRPYLVVALAALATAAVADVAGRMGYYQAPGLFITETVGRGNMVAFPGVGVVEQAETIVDSVVEESLELIGYAALLAAAMTYRQVGEMDGQPPDEV